MRDGAPATLASLAVREPPAAGFRFLIDAGLVDLTAEAIALRYPHRFAARAIEAARRKLAAEGFDLDTAEAVK